MASERVVIKNFLTDLPAIVQVLTDELDLEDISGTKRAKVVGWLRIIKQFKFVGYLIVLVDIHEVSQQLSTGCQSDSMMVIDLPGLVERATDRFEKLQSVLGAEASRRSPALAEGKLVMADADVAANGTRVLQVTADEEEEGPDGSGSGTVVGELSLLGANNAGVRLLSYQETICSKILGRMEERLPSSSFATAVLLKKIFDFRCMPLTGPSSTSEVLRNWGDAEMLALLEDKFPELQSSEVLVQYLQAKRFVRDRRGDFMHFKDSDDPSKGQYMKLVGQEASVFGGLWDAQMQIDEFRHLADYMISYTWQSCCVERGGSTVNMIKTKGRSGLDSETLNDLSFNTYNMPYAHEVDYDPFIDEWSAGNHYMGVTHADNASKVITRQQARSSETFLFKAP